MSVTIFSQVRPPAVPLIAHSPYFSVWSMNDRLNDDWPKHWTGATQGMCGLLRVDGHALRFMGALPQSAPPMKQVRLEVHPTRTVYEFEGAGVALTAEFMTPALPSDLMLLSRPATYLTLSARTIDGKPHDVRAYVDVSGEIAVNTANQKVWMNRHRLAGLEALSIRSDAQATLGRSGDDLRIEWGTFYLAGQTGVSESAIQSSESGRSRFMSSGKLADSDDMAFPRPADSGWPVVAMSVDFGSVVGSAVDRRLIFAYDEGFSVEYFHRRLAPLWRSEGQTASEMLVASSHEYDSVRARCLALDDDLEKKLTDRGGPKYAALASLAYRQCLAAHCLVRDADGKLLMFSKENFSNGCIGTVDVTYPGSPFFLYFNKALLRAQVEPILEYGSSAKWRWPFAPHDLGQYPLANGQVYGGGERTEENQMPVEESGNMLIMLGALQDKELALKYWPTLEKWARYLLEKGLDPENQLCTDDFAGHLAHNANLSIKAIVALGAFGKLCNLVGKRDEAKEFAEKTTAMAAKWKELAREGDHFRLAFDRPNSWSQKYNLVWDRLLGLHAFDPNIAKAETAFYLSKLNPFGLPLDERREYTKLDWCVWTACLTDDRTAFDRQIEPLFDWLSKTPTRVPLTDWFETKNAKQVGFQARSVVGGLFIPLLHPTKE